MTTYNIGDTAWYAKFDQVETLEVCPTCAGKRYLTVILGDDSRVTIDCATCSLGYDAPTGRIKQYTPLASVRQITITGVEQESGCETEYRFGGHFMCRQSALADTEAEAVEIAKRLGAEYCEDQNQRIRAKEKDTKSWAWNAGYHKRQIAEHRKQIEYHQQKLDAANTHKVEMKGGK